MSVFLGGGARMFAFKDEDEPRVEEEDVVTSHFWTGFVYTLRNTFLQKSSSCKNGCLFVQTLLRWQHWAARKKKTRTHAHIQSSFVGNNKKWRQEQEAEFVAKVCIGDIHVAVAAQASKAMLSFGVASLKFFTMRFYTVVSWDVCRCTTGWHK